MSDVADTLAVDVRGLVKSYSGMKAVGGIDLAIRHGEVFALLGPNGAGKTTTVEILEGYRSRDHGEVSVLGVDPGRQRARLKSRIGIVLQSPGIDRYLTVRETIAMYATFYPRPRAVDEMIHLVGLEEKRSARVLKLSGGQQRRLDVAIALVGNPELLFLDEPTTGFDPSARHEAWEVIKNLATLGMTVLLTTHYMDEAQRSCRRSLRTRAQRRLGSRWRRSAPRLSPAQKRPTTPNEISRGGPRREAPSHRELACRRVASTPVVVARDAHAERSVRRPTHPGRGRRAAAGRRRTAAKRG